MIEGIILKGIGGFYYVDTAEGLIECKARGRFRKTVGKPIVGDRVTLEIQPEDGTGYLQTIAPRKNSLIRPVVANLDLVVAVASAAPPVTAGKLHTSQHTFADASSATRPINVINFESSLKNPVIIFEKVLFFFIAFHSFFPIHTSSFSLFSIGYFPVPCQFRCVLPKCKRFHYMLSCTI